MPGCSYCRSVKEFLRGIDVEYQEIDLSVDEEGKAFMNQRGYTALPVTVIGETEISGYHMPKIKEALGIRE